MEENEEVKDVIENQTIIGEEKSESIDRKDNSLRII